MAWVEPISFEDADPESQKIWQAQKERHGRMTNMKKTLAQSPKALRALMEWYPLYDEVVEFLGVRPTTLFVHAISNQTDCLICSTFFRRWLIEAGEDPDKPTLNEHETLLIRFGQSLARNETPTPNELQKPLSEWLTPKQIVTLTSFGAMMVATNLFNNAIGVPLDDYLQPYRQETSR